MPPITEKRKIYGKSLLILSIESMFLEKYIKGNKRQTSQSISLYSTSQQQPGSLSLTTDIGEATLLAIVRSTKNSQAPPL